MKYSKNQSIILSLIKKDRKITAIELQKSLDISEKEFYCEIRELKQAGILKHIGMTNAGTWILMLPVTALDANDEIQV